MILCVQGHRALLPAPGTEAAAIGARSDPHHGFPSPASLHCAHSSPPLWDPTKDLLSIAQTFHYLDVSGWYWGAVSAGEARAVLQDTQEGTFLVRDSSHPLYMLTLSVKTGRGPTNVRIEYSHGQFRLDSSSLAKPRLLAFPDVPSLVQHYVKSNRAEEDTSTLPQPAPKENALLLKLVRPLRRHPPCPSLQHLARLAINRLTMSSEQLPLPRPLLHYLQDYPFQL
ncbi:cytokine-inducible SH2-containing protein isoform X2 [Scleropages formosus]|uniref:Cytokine-inducible SH2-containing protein n=1 Tax=Scleropages formosus TaxID=113540 RepID=A0A8C9W6W3_SCLFO|nr:cytokine-inducible SH2-containing protein isoform X2 [Scleropages formosus]